jgi:hypothetical protein
MIHVLRPRLQVLPATPRCLFCVEGFVKPGSTSGVCIGVRYVCQALVITPFMIGMGDMVPYPTHFEPNHHGMPFLKRT